MSAPRLLDLFCGAGGAAVGYHRAGFEVVGVDVAPQADYPFEFVQDGALEILGRLKMGGRVATYHHPSSYRGGVYDLADFDAIHASPPCQASSALTKGTNRGREYEQLIPQTRTVLRGTDLPTIIENVQGSALRRDLTLCGEMWGLGVIRHRYFEIDGFTATAPAHRPHRGRVRGWRHGVYYDGPYVAVYGEGGGKGSVAEWQAAMGIDWTEDRKAIAEAIPPSYSEWIGRQLRAQLEEAAA